MKQTGIKSPQTIASAYKKLFEVGAIETSPFHDNAYLIKTTHLYVPMSVSVLRFLLAFNKYVDPSILITTFAILARMMKLNNGKPVSFTKTMLGKLLGLAKQNIDNAGLVVVLALLEHSELITLSKKHYSNDLKVTCVQYTLEKVDTDGAQISDYLGEDSEFGETNISVLWNQILTVE